MGGLDSVSIECFLLKKVVGKNINTFIPQVPCHGFQSTLFSQNCL